MAWLKVISGRNSGATFNLGKRTLTAGRHPGNFIQILDKGVSRRHCQFRWDEKYYSIVDMNSQNGTLVNGEKVLEAELGHGDLVCIGKTVMEFIHRDSLTGAEDFAVKWKESRQEVWSVETSACDREELRALVWSLQDAQSKTELLPAVEPKPDLGGDAGLPEPDVLQFTDRLRKLVEEGSSRNTFWDTVTTGLAHHLGVDRVAVLLHHRDDKGHARLMPAAFWCRDELDDSCRKSPVSADAIRRVVESGSVVVFESPGEGRPSITLAAPVEHGGQWFGVIYTDTHSTSPPEFERLHFNLLEQVAGYTARYLESNP